MGAVNVVYIRFCKSLSLKSSDSNMTVSTFVVCGNISTTYNAYY